MDLIFKSKVSQPKGFPLPTWRFKRQGRIMTVPWAGHRARRRLEEGCPSSDSSHGHTRPVLIKPQRQGYGRSRPIFRRSPFSISRNRAGLTVDYSKGTLFYGWPFGGCLFFTLHKAAAAAVWVHGAVSAAAVFLWTRYQSSRMFCYLVYGITRLSTPRTKCVSISGAFPFEAEYLVHRPVAPKLQSQSYFIKSMELFQIRQLWLPCIEGAASVKASKQ